MRAFFFSLLGIALFCSCTQHNGFSLSGEVPVAWEGKPVLLMLSDVSQPCAVDSTHISNGKFHLKGRFDMPRYCSVVICLDPDNRTDRNKQIRFSLFIDSTAVKAVCDNSGQTPRFLISGSNTQQEYENFQQELQILRADRKKSFTAYTQAYYYGDNLQRAIELAKETTAKGKMIEEAQIAYVKNHPGSVISILVAHELCQVNSPLSLKEIEQLFTSLAPHLQESEMGKELRQTIQRRQVFIGEPFIDKALTAPDGTPQRISDFILPGHTTLIEFWASWCQPCRGEFPHLRKTYEKYHPKGFNIVSISIDSDADSWKKALEEERLPWGQLLDHNGRKTPERSAFRAYNLTGVPSSILVDEKGNMLLLNARGGWLDAAMQEIYDQPD